MSYQVLARKWRPKSFDTLVGQQHVLKALVNALEQNKLHHAYLFSGTRGVGKTTIARIFAKALNCESGVSANPCGTCPNCVAIDEGKFFDLIEIDAASRTRVEETRELLDNVQYKPTQGRYKVYLIDEVHMLSTHSFNALLKTLEEPPEYVKFLLATTDPEKLPITVLSRCLQFNLKHMTETQIAEHLNFILQQENIDHEQSALEELSTAAKGSMRDALSLLDQAIAFSDNSITDENIRQMLGTIEKTHIWEFLKALANHDGKEMLTVIENTAQYTSNFDNVLDEILAALHKVALEQIIPKSSAGQKDQAQITEFASKLSPEEVQLFYQIGLIGKKDITLAPTLRCGFEMTLLRMLTFDANTIAQNPPPQAAQQPTNPPIKKTAPPPSSNMNRTAPAAASQPPTPGQPQQTSNQWHEILPQLKLTGLTASLAKHCAMKNISDNTIELTLAPSQAPMLNDKQKERIDQALSAYFGKPFSASITVANSSNESPAQTTERKSQEAHTKAHQDLEQDPGLQEIMQAFDAKLDPSLIKVEQNS